MKIALLMNEHAYAGREYLSSLIREDLDFDIIVFDSSIGRIDVFEEDRCGGLWTPSQIEELYQGRKVYSFSSLKSIDLIEHLKSSSYDLAIQGGVGILKNEVIQLFSRGILNFHPGALPEYRGCTVPEWQIFHEKRVMVTCHFIAEGIDAGDVIEIKDLDLDYSSYESMRGTIYPKTAKFVVEILRRFINSEKIEAVPQNEVNASYYKPIPEKSLDKIKDAFPITTW